MIQAETRGGVAIVVVALVFAGCTTRIDETFFEPTPRGPTEGPKPVGESAPSADSPMARMRISGIRGRGEPSPVWTWHVNEETGGGTSSSGGEEPPPPAPTTSVATDKSSYAYGEQIKITFALFPGNAFDWVSFAPQGSSAETIAWWSYTHGAHGGSIVTHPVDALPPGTFVARGYYDDGWTVATESAPFTVGPLPALAASVTTDKTNYGGLETVVVTFNGLAGGWADWLGSYPTHASMLSYGPWSYTNGATSGTLSMPALYAGTQEIRAFEANRFELKGRSLPITVAPQVATDRTTYAAGEAVVVSFGGMAGPWSENFVALAEEGSAPEAYLVSVATRSAPKGARTFDVSALPDGTYVARAYFGSDPVAKATSPSFTIAR
jgi:hypothetical protein